MSSSAYRRKNRGRLVLLVVADDVTGVLTQEALDALAELLPALDVGLHHSALAVRVRGCRREGRQLGGLLVVVRHVADQIADHRERTHRRDRQRLGRLVVGQPRHAHQPRPTVDLGRAGAALAGLAVPADREIAGLRGLQLVDGVEDDLALLDRDGEVLQLPTVGVAAPHPHRQVVAHGACSNQPCVSTSALGLDELGQLVGHLR
jgi:hypothetical protein